jgi:SPP1 gp7 family putative phage head morphogenesis protein
MALINQDFVNEQIWENNLNFQNALLDLPADAKRDFRRLLTQGITQGKGLQEMVRDIRKLMTVLYNKSLRIVRTETHKVIENGHYHELLHAHNQGVDTKLQIIATLDDRTRPQSAQMDGNFSYQGDDESLIGLFQYPDGKWYVMGNTGIAEWDINDRETSIQVIDDISPQLRRTREDGIIPFKPYKEWAKEKGLTRNVYGALLFP